jgi:hypothetical protein
MSGNLALRHGIGQLLQLDDLVVDAQAVVRNDEKWIQRALVWARLIPADELLVKQVKISICNVY